MRAKGQTEIVVATQNQGKFREIRDALKGLGVRIQSLADLPRVPVVKENGKSFAENALKKARFYSRRFRKLTIADDSGLEVDALGGRPGIYSARYGGEGASDRKNNQKLLREMAGVPHYKRGATFRCCIAIVSPKEGDTVVEGKCRGKIGFKEIGRRGFGYDPLFILPQFGRTMAELTLKEKNRISHRGKALRKLRKTMEKLRVS